MLDVVVKEVVAEVSAVPDEPDSPHGTFEVILSAPVVDRDGETLQPDEWEQPLPDHITIDIDHGMSVASTVGSGRPALDEHGNLRIRGSYASTELAQTTRALVTEGHIRTTSVAFLRKQDRKTGKPRRELLNGAFVAVPANPAARVLDSKNAKDPPPRTRTDARKVQAIHDHAYALGASCMPPSDKDITHKASVSDTAWSKFSADDYSIEQWRRACLIGPPQPSESKDDYKLPIREPDGTLNRNGIHAATAALAGARGGVQASAEQKARAARALVALYRRELDEDPPESLTRLAGTALREQLAGIDTTALPGPVRGVLAALGVLDPDDEAPPVPADEPSAAADPTTAVAVYARRIQVADPLRPHMEEAHADPR